MSSVPELPARFGRYDVLTKLAEGGMATVYVGRAVGAAGFERLVAIKACHPTLLGDESFRAMFLDEARLAARIHHPNVVPTLDVADDDGLYLVMDYVEGAKLSDWIRAERDERRGVAPEMALRVMVDALRGLHAAHEAKGAAGEPLGLVHRDVSPQNLVVGVDGTTRVLDFGIAKAEARATVTSEHTVKGKLGYLSPEQLGGGAVTPRTDVFAAGVVLWETLTGRRLFTGDSRQDVLQKILYVPIKRPSRVASVPETLDAVVMRALEREPSARYPSAAAFADALEGCGIDAASPAAVGQRVEALFAEPLEARRRLLRERMARPSATVEPPMTEAPPRRSALWLAGVLAAVLVAGAVGALVTLWMASPTPERPAADAEESPRAPPARVAEPVPVEPAAEPEAAPVEAPPVEAAPAEAAPAEAAPAERRRRRRRRAPRRARPDEPFNPGTI